MLFDGKEILTFFIFPSSIFKFSFITLKSYRLSCFLCSFNIWLQRGLMSNRTKKVEPNNYIPSHSSQVPHNCFWYLKYKQPATAVSLEAESFLSSSLFIAPFQLKRKLVALIIVSCCLFITLHTLHVLKLFFPCSFYHSLYIFLFFFCFCFSFSFFCC